MSEQTELPDHWERIPVANFAELISGQHILSDDYHQEPDDGGTPYLTGPADFGDDYPEVSKWTHKPKAMAQEDDVLLTVKGANVGKTNVLDINEAAISRQLMAIRPKTALSKYIYYYFRNNFSAFQRLGAGSTVPGIDQESVLGFEVPLPPLPEQRRIVAKIEELFTNLDAGQSDLATAGQQLERYRLSVLQAAVEGRLTADWRRTHVPEPADQLLERIEEERRRGWERDYRMRRYDIKDKEPPSGWKDRYDPPEKPDKAELGEIPDSWEWVVVDQLSPNIHYGYTVSAQDEPVGPKFLRITDIQQDGQVNWEDAPYCEIGEQERKKYLLEPGDILFARTGGTVGKSCLIEDGVPEAVFASYLIRVITVDSIDERYVYLFFQTLDYWRQISEKKTGIGQPNVNATKLSKLTLPLPPLAEQKQIVDEVERLLSVADDAAATAEREQTRAERLRQSILKQAFSGRLVPHEEDAYPPSIDGTASERSSSDSSDGTDSDVEDLLGSADPSKQIEMDL